ncbi:hypothetical protein [Dokdonella soli]|uniref:Uncharacterized protein n=1 Tax=Dokdonella soli TaxID=529810 RepID=A0ABP3TLY6_9GAMM
MSSLAIALPVGTVSVSVSVYVQAAAGGSADYLFDDIRFGPSGTVPVELQSFDIE